MIRNSFLKFSTSAVAVCLIGCAVLTSRQEKQDKAVSLIESQSLAIITLIK